VLSLGGSCESDGDGHSHREPETVYRQETVYRDGGQEYRGDYRGDQWSGGGYNGGHGNYPPPPPPGYRPPPDQTTVYRETTVYPDYDRPNRIPRWSDIVADKDGKIRWTADLDGTIYVYDKDKDFIRYSGPIRRGQELIVQPGDDLIYVDQKIVSHENLRRDAHHQVFFARERHDSGYSNRPDSGHSEDPGRTIPKGSVRVSTGKGNLAIDAARGHGTAYVFDENDRNVVYTQDLDKGNSFQIFPDKGYINVNSKKTANVKFRNGHTFSIYYKDK
jgi:hypothetical protein